MNIASAKDLETYLKICRKLGVLKLTIGPVSFELSPQSDSISTKRKRRKSITSFSDPYPDEIDAPPTEEELLYYSADSAVTHES